MAYLYLFLCIIFSIGQLMSNKLFQMRQRITIPSYMIYLIVIGIVSTPIFFLMSGCDTFVDGKLFVYSFAAAAIVVTHALFSLLSMAYVNIAVVTIVQNAGSLVIPSLYGFLFLREPVTIPCVLALVLVMAAFLIIFLESRFSDEKENNAQSKLLYVLLFVTSGIGNVIPKAFTVSGSQASSEAYLTWINIFMTIMVTLAFFLAKWKRKQTMRVFTSGIQAKNYLVICLGSVSGCVASVCSMKAITQMNIAIYSPLSSAMNMVFLLFVSRIVFKEKISVQNIFAAILGIAAVVCSVL